MVVGIMDSMDHSLSQQGRHGKVTAVHMTVVRSRKQEELESRLVIVEGPPLVTHFCQPGLHPPSCIAFKLVPKACNQAFKTRTEIIDLT